ncbi:prenyltransferase [bacterium]|nr:prenyltransferase [bacterium]
MNSNRPGFLNMVRAPFLSSIISPLIAGTLLAYYIGHHVDFLNFGLVLILGICFHVATNVYNDIYDTLQGTDEINMNRNEFSGGSGVIVQDPSVLPVMLRIARIAWLAAILISIILLFRVQPDFRIPLVILTVLSAFFSKYYTAAPIKLAYRGWGEFSVWFAFGPMAIAVAVIGQNVRLSPGVLIAMPITGISTLSILLIGQIIDLDADRAAGKWGVAVRRGIKTTGILYGIFQILLCVNIVVLAAISPGRRWPILLTLIPYAILLPQVLKTLWFHTDDLDKMKKAAGQNVLLHLAFSTLFVMTFLISILMR